MSRGNEPATSPPRVSYDWKAWEITCCGVTGIAIAETRARARYTVARSAAETGYARTVGAALMTTRCRRAKKYDFHALLVCREAFLTLDELPLSGKAP